MTTTARYRIPDEPRGSVSAKFVCDPMWPLFATMFGGLWFGVPWFVFNAFAMGSPTRMRELVTLVCAVIGLLLAASLVVYGVHTGVLPTSSVPYLVIGIVCARLAVAYVVYQWQSTPFELWQYYGGTPMNGMLLVFGGGFFLRRFLEAQPGLAFFRMALG